jgi:hypothetical protein
MKANASLRFALIIILIMVCSFSLFAQDQGNCQSCKPELHLSVHKQTDANGNVISYDSTYTYVYSGKCHSDAYVDSIMKKYGLDMNGMMFSMPLNTPDLSNYPLIQQFGLTDFDKMQQVLQNQMNEMMQMYGLPPSNGFFCQPPPTPQCCPKDSMKTHPQQPEKRNCPKHNKAKGSTQI